MRIVEIKAFPVTVPVPPEYRVRLGIGVMVKRDNVFVKVTTESGLIGWGESHHGRAHLAIATLINTTLKQLVLGMDATDVNGVWARIYKFQLGSHGMGAACAMAMSGIDMALWEFAARPLVGRSTSYWEEAATRFLPMLAASRSAFNPPNRSSRKPKVSLPPASAQ